MWDSSSTAFRNLAAQGMARGVEYVGRSESVAEYGDIPA
jgi:hypothetical protein